MLLITGSILFLVNIIYVKKSKTLVVKLSQCMFG